MLLNAAERILDAAIAQFPDKPALLFRGQEITYAALRDMVYGFAVLLQSRGLRPQDAVAIHLSDCPAFLTAFLGSMLFGAVPVPIGQNIPASDRAFILHDARAVLLVTDDTTIQVSSEVDTVSCDCHGAFETLSLDGEFQAYQPISEDLAFMLYTSGSTGRPKGVPHGHEDVLVPSAALGPIHLGVISDDVILSASKLSFSYGLMAQFGVGLACGASVLLHTTTETELLPHVLVTQRPTVFFAVPAVYDMLLRSLDTQDDLSGIRVWVSSGEAMPGPLQEAWKKRTGKNIIELFGSTESFTSFLVSEPGVNSPGTLGHPVIGFDIRLVDDLGKQVQDGELGKLQVRGPGVARSYWNRPERSVVTMLADGWLDTGDLCVRINREIRLVGRSDDLFRSSGQWVPPVLVENCLLEHPAVAQCAVAPCRVRGMLYPCAFVVLADATSQQDLSGDLIRYAKARLPRHMCPVQITFLNELPRTATGKVQRFKLAV